MKDKKILVIDDDPITAQLLMNSLNKARATVAVAEEGQAGLQKFYAFQPDLVILDVMLPDMTGWEICRIMRRLSDVPIVMLTSQSHDEFIIQGLDSGADDYITKPFNAQVVLARLRAVLRRTGAEAVTSNSSKASQYDDGYLRIDLEHNLVVVQGEVVKLTGLEYKLLAYFLENANKVLTVSQILQSVWGWEYQDDSGHVRIYVWHLRKKLEEDPKNPQYFLTEHGLGYRFMKREGF